MPEAKATREEMKKRDFHGKKMSADQTAPGGITRNSKGWKDKGQPNDLTHRQDGKSTRIFGSVLDKGAGAKQPEGKLAGVRVLAKKRTGDTRHKRWRGAGKP